MRTALTAALTAGMLLALPAAPALAHNVLEKAAPADKSILATAPAQVRLTFSSRLSSLVTIVVTDEAKQKVATTAPAVAGATATVRFAGPPANGIYTVAYRVVSGDGHTVQGSYAFRVAVPGATTAPPTTAPPTTTPATPAATATFLPTAGTATDDGGGGALTALLVVVPVALLATGGILLARRRARG